MRAGRLATGFWQKVGVRLLCYSVADFQTGVFFIFIFDFSDPYIRWVDLGSIFHEMGLESAKMTFETTPGRKISFRIDLDHSRGPKHP